MSGAQFSFSLGVSHAPIPRKESAAAKLLLLWKFAYFT